jgi:AcrR family transcriptional regulator
MLDEKEVRDQIIDAATRTLRKWGLKKTTMEDIAAEAGKGKATLYYYFKNRDEIIKSVVEKQISEIIDAIQEELNKEESAARKLKKYVMVMFVESRKRVTVFNILKNEIRESKELIINYKEKFDVSDIQLIHNIIQYGIKRGEFAQFSSEEVSTLAYGISSAIRSILINLLFDQDLPEETQRIDTIGDYLVRGLVTA